MSRKSSTSKSASVNSKRKESSSDRRSTIAQSPSLSAEDRAGLLRVLRHAISHERRFGIREECTADVELAWHQVIDQLDKLFGR